MCDINPDDLILKQIHVCHRHGDRATAFRVPINDKQVELEEQFWKTKILDNTIREKLSMLFPNCGYELSSEDEKLIFGKLIYEGLDCLIQLGKQLNEKYIQTNFLHLPFQSGEIKCYCTNSYRTYESVQGLLYGLLELDETTNKRENWFPSIKVMRKPPHPLNPHDDYSWKLFNKPELQTKIHEDSKEYDEILPELRKYLYSDKKYEYMRFRDYFYCMDHYNIPLEKDIECYKKIVITQCSHIFCLTYQDHDLGKYRMEYYLSKIYHQMINSKHNFNNLKTTITGCHDNSILSLLALFKPDLCMIWPKYGASVIFELYMSKKDDKFYIRILYNFDAIIIEKINSFYIPLETFPSYFI